MIVLANTARHTRFTKFFPALSKNTHRRRDRFLSVSRSLSTATGFQKAPLKEDDIGGFHKKDKEDRKTGQETIGQDQIPGGDAATLETVDDAMGRVQ